MRWWARLRGNRLNNLKGLLRHPELTAAFDALLNIPGLWGGMQLTTIHSLIALKFDEVSPLVQIFSCHLLVTGNFELPRAYSAVLV
jgi:Protein of unknown function (DUF3723)